MGPIHASPKGFAGHGGTNATNGTDVEEMEKRKRKKFEMRKWQEEENGKIEEGRGRPSPYKGKGGISCELQVRELGRVAEEEMRKFENWGYPSVMLRMAPPLNISLRPLGYAGQRGGALWVKRSYKEGGV